MNIIYKLLCKLGLHHKKLIKFFTSLHNDETYSLDFYGYECLRCKTRFIKEHSNSHPLLGTIQSVEYWVSQRARPRNKKRTNHLKVIK